MHGAGLANILSAMGIGKTRAAMLACAALASTAQAAAVEPLVLEPSSPWVADFKDESCAIRRSFSGEGQKVTLELDTFGLGDVFDVGIDGGTLKRGSGEVHARFEPDERLGDHPETLRVSITGGGRGVIYSDQIFRQDDVEARKKQSQEQGYFVPWSNELRTQREAEISGLFVSDAFERDVLLKTGSLSKPMAVMRQCIDDLVKAKGIDPASLLHLTRAPTPKEQMRWAKSTMENYPPDVVRDKKSGTVAIRLTVGEDGKVADCVALPRGEDPRLDKAACDSALKYARFDPALDAAGKPIKTFWATKIVYSLR